MRRVRLFHFGFLVLLVGLAWLTWRIVGQAKLDRALLTAIQKNDTQAVTALLDHGANPNATYRPEETLFFGSSAYLWEQLRWNFQHPIPSRAALLVAVGWQDTAAMLPPPPPENATLVKALLQHGADTECLDAGGNTPLLIAASRHMRNVVPLLLEYGAHTNVRNKHGETAFALARESADIGLISLLKQAGEKK